LHLTVVDDAFANSIRHPLPAPLPGVRFARQGEPAVSVFDEPHDL
jgi:hypothetical protein